MGTKLKKNSNKSQLNPNWAVLQKSLSDHGRRPSKHSADQSETLTTSILGKRKERSDSKPGDSQISTNNPLTPVNDDLRTSIGRGIFKVLIQKEKEKQHVSDPVKNIIGSLTDTVAMDCEMVGVGQGNRSALGRVTLVNKWGNVIFDEFVRPIERVVDFRTQISGIRPRDLRKAKDFSMVQNKVAEFIKGRILVGHALRNDLKALLLSHPKNNIRDTSEYPPFQRQGHRSALRHLAASFLNVEIQSGEHCPVEDARAAMLLYEKNRKDWEKLVKDQMRLKQKQKKRKPKKKTKQGDDLHDNDATTVT